MLRLVRHVAAFGTLSLLVLTGYHFAANAASSVASVGDDTLGEGGVPEMIRRMTATNAVYDLSTLRYLKRVNDLVDQQYVDPSRIDYAGMFRAALDAVEQLVPEVVLRTEGDGTRLHIEVGTYQETLALREHKSFGDIEYDLQKVAAVLETELDPTEVKLPEVEYALINGILGTLDPHSNFQPPEISKKMDEDNEGEFGGIGITIQIRENQLTIEYPLEDTPAWKAGLKAGDRIVKIEGEGTLNMDLDEAVSKMRGPPNSPVTITVMRDSFETPQDFTIVRDVIKPSAVRGELLEGNIGYISISSFHAQVDVQLTEVLSQLGREAGPGKLRGVILDLRGNPGGFLHQAVAVADKFLADGVIVSTVERNGRNREEKYARAAGTEPQYPMVVLMSGNSASAAEIVAGALRNQERAAIVGERSFGKGSVQNLYPFPDDSKLKLTTGRYLTPGDHSIQSVGIPPDLELLKAVVAPPREVTINDKKEQSGPRVALFFRDNQMREADLEQHLDNDETATLEPSIYSLRYLLEDFDSDEPVSDRFDVRKDFEVMLAREVLLSSSGSRRADVLRGAEKVAAAHQPGENKKIEQAFKAISIDWSACANPESASVQMALNVANDGTLDAGTYETLTATMTNTGDKPLCQVLARSKSGNDRLDGIEYYFGRIAPGETRSYTTRVQMPEGYPDEVSNVDFVVTDLSDHTLAETSLTVRSKGLGQPRYAWSWRFDDSAGGDGDGVVEVGETVALKVDVLNVGEAMGGEVGFVFKKQPGLGKVVELKEGSFSFEKLAPGARASGEASFEVLQAPADGQLGFTLRVRETERYDYSAVMKAGFYDYYTQSEDINLTLGEVPPAAHREQPQITFSRAPELSATDARVTLSGVATDDAGVRDVIVYHGTEKIAYTGSGGSTPLRSVPFSTTTTLKAGNNLLVVLVRDIHGMTWTRSMDVYLPPGSAEPTAAVTP